MSSQTEVILKQAGRKVLLYIGLFSIGVNLLMLTAPLYMLQIYDRVLTSGRFETLLYLTLIAVFALVVLGLLDVARKYSLGRMSDWMDQTLATPILGHLVRGVARNNQPPSTVAVRDIATVRTYLSSEAPFALMDMPWVLVFITFVFVLHLYLGLVALAGAALLLLIVLLNQKTTGKAAQKANAAASERHHKTESIVRNASAIEAMGMGRDVSAVFERDNAAALSEGRRFAETNTAFTATTKVLRMGLQVAILGVGAFLAVRGDISPGAMIAGSILMGRALAPIEMAVGSWRQTVSAKEALERTRATLASMDEEHTMSTLPEPLGHLSVEGVSYVHPGQTEPTLLDLNFKVEPGKMLGVIGPMGTGKSTLVRLLVGLIKPTRGTVRLDGVDLAAWDHDEVGPHIGYLPQNVDLLTGTVGQNIARFKEGRHDDMYAAAQSVGMHEVILKLPGGYDARVGEGGAYLSGGQRQRIGLARALFGGPKFVVLDEPNANLDRVGENALIQAILRLKAEGRSVIVVSHRPRILEMAEEVLVLMPGAQSQIGPRDKVLASVGAPQTMVSMPGPEGEGA